MSNTAVYTAIIPDRDLTESAVYPPLRQSELDRCSNERVKREKYYVWKLLEIAIFREFGEQIENIRFEKNEKGKWLSDSLCFSLSHTDRVVAVAVSDRPVGVDVEAVRRHREGLETHILTESERIELCGLDTDSSWEYIIKKWTQKESIFKAGDKGVFEPTKIETEEFSVQTRCLELPFGKYMLSVCSDDAENVKFVAYDL